LQRYYSFLFSRNLFKFSRAIAELRKINFILTLTQTIAEQRLPTAYFSANQINLPI
jgi:hypothetical protein